MQIDDFKVKTFPSIESIGRIDNPMENGERLRVCIVTEEIIGPVRNGGIASTYYHLSKGLAAHGHDVHVLFLKGPVVQDETPEHWVEHFAAFGVTLHYLEQPTRPLWGAAVEWQGRFMAAYEWLRDNDTFDVVHTSEWRGGLIYALMAKRMGLAFQETLFLVKTSSPHIWNRHYQMQPIERRELVLAAYAEQKCVELADAVIGGSAHLITFMEEIGYHVPKKNVFVQPNIVDFAKVIVTDQRPPRAPGDLVKTQELIFFGRLEGRKGVELMCNALDILKERGIAPSQVTFMGKWGAPLATQGGMPVKDYIESKAENWDFPVGVIDDKNQPEALSHMCSRDMIAVMPSLIENSTMAVYETLENNIPFIATAVGGTPELIDAGDHERCLVEPKSQSLADQLERVLKEGQVIATSSFSNDENLNIWYGFHAHVGEQIKLKGRAKAIAEITKGMDPKPKNVNGISYVLLARRGDDLGRMADALEAEAPDEILLAFTDAAMRPAIQAMQSRLSGAGLNVQVTDCIGQAAGDALNMLVAAQSRDCVVVSDGADVTPRPGFFEAAKTALAQRPDCLFTTFFEADDELLGMPVGGDVASQFTTSRAYGPEVFAMHKQARRKLGDFEPYDVRRGIVHEYVTRMVEKGGADLMVFPEALLSWPDALVAGKELASDTVYSYLKAKPLIDGASLSQRKITLASLHQSGGGSLSAGTLRDGGRVDGETVWLMPVEWDRRDVARGNKRAMLVGLDETQNRMWFYAKGEGERVLNIRDVPQKLTEVQRFENAGPKSQTVTLSYFDIPDTWDVGTSYPVSWILAVDGEKTRNQFMRITKVSEGVMALVSRMPIMTELAVIAVLDAQTGGARLQNLLEETGDQKVSALDATALSDDSALNAALGLAEDPINVGTPIDTSGLSGLDAGLDLNTLVGLTRASETNVSASQISRQTILERSAPLMTQQMLHPVQKTGDVRSFLSTPNTGYWDATSWFTGWVWDRADRSRILHVALMIDDMPVIMVKADTVVPALGKRTPGLERHGFRLPMIEALLDPEVRLELRVWENQVPIRDGVIVPSLNPDGSMCLVKA
jgi:glycosyltransferase involved in cell wall biosynthesis